jgi:FkbM family methyltransferase
MWLHDHLSDEESKRQLYLHLRFRLTLDYAMVPSWDRILWPWRLDDASIVYIDCGAFDGDTLLPFVKSYSDRLRLAIPIEPDTGNFRRLKNNIDRLPFEMRSKVRALSAATGGKSELRAFNSTLNQASSLSASGSHRVQVVTLDEIVEGSCQKSDRLVIKIDVEGAESETLQGASQTICNRQPFLAVSVYHSPTDLWSLPQAIYNNNSNYRFALRSNGADGADLVAYAFPSS